MGPFLGAALSILSEMITFYDRYRVDITFFSREVNSREWFFIQPAVVDQVTSKP